MLVWVLTQVADHQVGYLHRRSQDVYRLSRFEGQRRRLRPRSIQAMRPLQANRIQSYCFDSASLESIPVRWRLFPFVFWRNKRIDRSQLIARDGRAKANSQLIDLACSLLKLFAIIQLQ